MHDQGAHQVRRPPGDRIADRWERAHQFARIWVCSDSDAVMCLAYTVLTSLGTSPAPRQEFIERRLAFELDVEGSTVKAS